MYFQLLYYVLFKIIIRERIKLQDKYSSDEKSILPSQLSVLRSMLSLDRHQNPEPKLSDLYALSEIPKIYTLDMGYEQHYSLYNHPLNMGFCNFNVIKFVVSISLLPKIRYACYQLRNLFIKSRKYVIFIVEEFSLKQSFNINTIIYDIFCI